MSKKILAGILFFLGSYTVQAAAYLNVQPIQVCDNNRNNCADPAQNLYLDITEAIWAQAGIAINFLPWVSINDSEFQDFSSPTSNLYHLWLGNPNVTGANTTADVVNMWFVNELQPSVLGTTQVGGPYSIIGDLTFAGDYSDVIAHELGHTLGLVHNTDPLALMNPSPRSPGSVDDIYSNGTGTDELFTDEIARALQSHLLTSEPISVGLTTSAASSSAPEPLSLLIVAVGLCTLFPLSKLARRESI